MHRSRLSTLVLFAALTACSTRDELLATELLSEDPTLVARLATDRRPEERPLPDACGAAPVAARAAAQPDPARQSEADELTRRAYDAETHGQVEEARALLRRAFVLDGTNKSAAYHLGRTSEALGDRAGALTAYCRYLTLGPTPAEATEAGERVATLSQPAPRVAAGSDRESAPARPRVAAPSARRVARAAPVVAPRVVASAERPAPGTSAERGTLAATADADAPSRRAPVTTAARGDDSTDSTAVAGGDVAPTLDPAPADVVDQPATASRTASRGPSRAQRAGIGAAAGAILGAVTGRGVKGAVIGAAAGGVLGGVMGGGVLPVGRGIRH